MDPGTQHRLKGTFDAAAPRYVAGRPSYPAVAVDWLIGRRPGVVLDLAAGSGALARALVPCCASVVAAEPSRNLLFELRTAPPVAAAVQATAERLPFAGASFDVVTVATAFHWFDAEQALSEIARVLRPGGHLGLVWNTRAVTDGWAHDLDDLLRAAQPATLQGDWGTASVRALDQSEWFAPPERAEFPHTQRLDCTGLVDLVASRSYVIALAESARARLLAQVAALFDANADPGATLDLPYVAQCWKSAVRRTTTP